MIHFTGDFYRKWEFPPPSLRSPEGKRLAAFFKSCRNCSRSRYLRAPPILLYYAAPEISRRCCRRQQALPVPVSYVFNGPSPDHHAGKLDLANLRREAPGAESARAQWDPRPISQSNPGAWRLRCEHSCCGHAWSVRGDGRPEGSRGRPTRG